MEEIFTTYNILAVLIGYMLGSIPTAVWVGKAFYGKDVREFGSGNAGATNTFRVLGKKAGIPVLIIDIAKGWAAVTVLSMYSGYSVGSDTFISLQIAIGIAAVVGHREHRGVRVFVRRKDAEHSSHAAEHEASQPPRNGRRRLVVMKVKDDKRSQSLP